MKISSFFKSHGCSVQLGTDLKCDLHYISVVFKKNLSLAMKILSESKCDNVTIGGSGFSLLINLPDSIEYLKPDYSLYPDSDYSLGYTSRGCPRKCHFCVVPQKEGDFRIAQHPKEFHNDNFKKITLLDNNILYNPDWFFEVTDFLLEKRLKVDFLSGLDIRYLTPEIADRLRILPKFKPLKFAFDDSSRFTTLKVFNGIHTLKESGINPRSCLFYVYVHDDLQLEDAVSRCNFIKKMGGTAFSMCNCDNDLSSGMKYLKRYTRPWAFWSSDFGYVREGHDSFNCDDLFEKYSLVVP